MKILLVTGAIYAQNSSRKHFTGLDYVVTQIGQSLSNDNEIVFFTTSPIGEKSVVEGCKVYSYSNMSVIPYILKVGLKKYANVMKMKCSFKEKIKNARSMIIAEYFESIIEKEKPDIIHINGITYGNLLCANKAAKKYCTAYTLHGLSYKSNECSDFQKNIEKSFISSALEKNIKFSVVSSGVLKNIENDFKRKSNAYIIKNTIDIKKSGKNRELLRKKYGIPNDANVLICVGSIGQRKNQVQIIRAYQLLPDEYKEKLYIILAGKNNIKGYINKEIEKINIKDRVIITGFVDKNTLAELYEISDANIVVSKSEGFGLSIIEAGYFGLPTIMYKDLDAYEDVYFKGGFTIVENREDKNVKDAIIETFNTDWNKNFIKREVEKNKKDLKNQYIRFYNDAIKECVFLDINKIIKEVNCFENEI